MKYAIINDAMRVQEIIPAFVDAFPEIPIEERYTKEYIKNAVKITDDVEVNTGDDYLPLLNVFALRIVWDVAESVDAVAGSEVRIPIYFSELGEVVITNDVTAFADASISGTELVIVPHTKENFAVHLEYTEVKFGRKIETDVLVNIVREIEKTEDMIEN